MIHEYEKDTLKLKVYLIFESWINEDLVIKLLYMQVND